MYPESKPPPLATKYYPEFQGRQLNIKDMFSAPQPAIKRPVSQQQDYISCQQAPATKRAKQSNAAKKPAKITNFFTTTKTKKQDVNVNVQVSIRKLLKILFNIPSLTLHSEQELGISYALLLILVLALSLLYSIL